MNRKNKIINFFVVVFSMFCIIIIITNQENSSSVLAILTFVYVLLTYYILQSNNKAIKEQLRPYVVLTLPAKVHDVNLLIENIGKRPAYDVKIKIEPELNIYQDDFTSGNYKSFLEQKFIAPNQKFECYLFDVFDLVSDKGKDLAKSFTVSLTYRSLEHINYSENYIIDFSSYITGKDAVKPDINHILEGVQKEINDLNRKLDLYIKSKMQNRV